MEWFCQSIFRLWDSYRLVWGLLYPLDQLVGVYDIEPRRLILLVFGNNELMIQKIMNVDLRKN